MDKLIFRQNRVILKPKLVSALVWLLGHIKPLLLVDVGHNKSILTFLLDDAIIDHIGYKVCCLAVHPCLFFSSL